MTNEFIIWLETVRAEHGGTNATLTKALGLKGRSTVGAWFLGDNKPSIKSCKLLAQLTKTDWRWIAALAESECRTGSGNYGHDQDDVNLPASEPETDPLDTTLWKPAFEGCTGCANKRAMKRGHVDRIKACRVLVSHELPTPCGPFDSRALRRLIHKLEELSEFRLS